VIDLDVDGLLPTVREDLETKARMLGMPPGGARCMTSAACNNELKGSHLSTNGKFRWTRGWFFVPTPQLARNWDPLAQATREAPPFTGPNLCVSSHEPEHWKGWRNLFHHRLFQF
jgi:hypothetical protein